jgi:acyl carrier protein
MSMSGAVNVGMSEVSVPPQINGQPVLSQVMTLLKGIRPLMANGEAYEQNTTLGDVGFTSLEMVNVMLAVETAFDFMIPAGDITPGNFKTAASIAAMISRLRPGA